MNRRLVSDLYDINVLKFGKFKLKSGIISPLYVDVREIIGYPKLMRQISEKIFEIMDKNVDQICGVPYTALPFASYISTNYEKPLVIKRKESKTYGTKKLIEGVFEKNMTCSIIEDVITTGSSVLETAKDLQSAGLRVNEVIVLIDRCQGGRDNLVNFGLNVKSVFTIHEILSILLSLKNITLDQYEICKEFIETTSVATPLVKKPSEIDWKERVDLCNNKIGEKLLTIINLKETSLCVAADVQTMGELLTLAKQIAPYICVLKVHSDIIQDFNIESMRDLKQLSIEENFLLMEDRKFADIGNTVKLQLTNSHFNYTSWCDLITVHALPGDGIIDGIREALNHRISQMGIVIVAEMSSKGALTNEAYKERCNHMASLNSDIVVGFVSQSIVCENMPGFIHFTPGVKLENGSDSLGQGYRSVSDLKKEGFVDVFIVGRGITEATNATTEAKEYRQTINNVI